MSEYTPIHSAYTQALGLLNRPTHAWGPMEVEVIDKILGQLIPSHMLLAFGDLTTQEWTAYALETPNKQASATALFYAAVSPKGDGVIEPIYALSMGMEKIEALTNTQEDPLPGSVIAFQVLQALAAHEGTDEPDLGFIRSRMRAGLVNIFGDELVDSGVINDAQRVDYMVETDSIDNDLQMLNKGVVMPLAGEDADNFTGPSIVKLELDPEPESWLDHKYELHAAYEFASDLFNDILVAEFTDPHTYLESPLFEEFCHVVGDKEAIAWALFHKYAPSVGVLAGLAKQSLHRPLSGLLFVYLNYLLETDINQRKQSDDETVRVAAQADEELCDHVCDALKSTMPDATMPEFIPLIVQTMLFANVDPDDTGMVGTLHAVTRVMAITPFSSAFLAAGHNAIAHEGMTSEDIEIVDTMGAILVDFFDHGIIHGDMREL